MAKTISKPVRIIRAISIVVWHLLQVVWILAFSYFGIFILPGIVQYTGQYITLPLSSFGVLLAKCMPVFYLLSWWGVSFWLLYRWRISLNK